MRLAEDHTSYIRPAKAGDGGNAIKQLKRAPALTPADGGDILEGLWAMSHTKGSHPGRSDADETRFRLHAITATARLLLHRFPACRDRTDFVPDMHRTRKCPSEHDLNSGYLQFKIITRPERSLIELTNTRDGLLHRSGNVSMSGCTVNAKPGRWSAGPRRSGTSAAPSP